MTTFNQLNSILTHAYMTAMLGVAKAELEQDHQLMARLMVKSNGPTRSAFRLPALPADAAQRGLYFVDLGVRLKRQLGEIDEAVFVSEVRWTRIAPIQANGKGGPTPHLARQAAIILIGRNATNTQQSVLMQPFTRDRLHNPVWGTTLVENYGPPSGLRMHGLLDLFFKGNQEKIPYA